MQPEESPRLEAARAGAAEQAAFRGEEVAADVIQVAKGPVDVIRVAEEGGEVAGDVIRVKEADVDVIRVEEAAVDVIRVAEGGEKA